MKLKHGIPLEVLEELARAENPSRPLNTRSEVEIAGLAKTAKVGVVIALDLRTPEGALDLDRAAEMLAHHANLQRTSINWSNHLNNGQHPPDWQGSSS